MESGCFLLMTTEWGMVICGYLGGSLMGDAGVYEDVSVAD
jgi:hypothetical protein